MKSNRRRVPEDEADHQLAPMQRLALAVDDAGFDQRNHAVREHLAVNAQVAAVAQAMEDRIRNAADADLQRRAVGDQRRDVARDPVLQVGVGFGRQFEQRARRLDHGGEFGDVQEAVAERPRHLVVDFGDDVAGAACRRQRAIDRRPQAHEAVRIGRRHLHQDHIERHGAAGEQIFDFAEEDRSVVGAALLHGFAHVASQEQAVVAEMPCEFGTRVGSVAERHHVNHFDVAQVRASFDQRLHEWRGSGTARFDPDAVAGPNTFKGLPGIRESR